MTVHRHLLALITTFVSGKIELHTNTADILEFFANRKSTASCCFEACPLTCDQAFFLSERKSGKSAGYMPTCTLNVICDNFFNIKANAKKLSANGLI